jgi:hypothetical protein
VIVDCGILKFQAWFPGSHGFLSFQILKLLRFRAIPCYSHSPWLLGTQTCLFCSARERWGKICSPLSNYWLCLWAAQLEAWKVRLKLSSVKWEAGGLVGPGPCLLCSGQGMLGPKYVNKPREANYSLGSDSLRDWIFQWDQSTVPSYVTNQPSRR